MSRAARPLSGMQSSEQASFRSRARSSSRGRAGRSRAGTHQSRAKDRRKVFELLNGDARREDGDSARRRRRDRATAASTSPARRASARSGRPSSGPRRPAACRSRSAPRPRRRVVDEIVRSRPSRDRFPAGCRRGREGGRRTPESRGRRKTEANRRYARVGEVAVDEQPGRAVGDGACGPQRRVLPTEIVSMRIDSSVVPCVAFHRAGALFILSHASCAASVPPRIRLLDPYSRHILVCVGGFCSPDPRGRELYQSAAVACCNVRAFCSVPERVKRGETPCLGVCTGGQYVNFDWSCIRRGYSTPSTAASSRPHHIENEERSVCWLRSS